MARTRNHTKRMLAKSMALALLTGSTLVNAGCFGLIGSIIQAVTGVVGSLGSGGCSSGCGGGGGG